jgi:hypothetical protein
LASFADESQASSRISIENSSTGELVIGVPNFNMKRYDDFIKTVSSINGIRNIEYCSGAEVFLVQFDSSTFRSSEEAFKAIDDKMSNMELYHKSGVSHAALKADC